MLLSAAVALAAETRTTSFVSGGGNGPFEAEYAGSSADGSQIFFETEEGLVPGDENETTDVYEWSAGTTTLVSDAAGGAATAAGTYFVGTSADGLRVFFETDDPLLPEDEDESQDIYERAGGTLALVSTGTAGGDAEINAEARFVSADGLWVVFQTDEPLVAADKDKSRDVYRGEGGVTSLVSTSPTDPNSEVDAMFAAATEGGAVFFYTPEKLVAEDEDTAEDLYERAGGTTTWLSFGPSGGNGGQGVSGAKVSADGSRVFFETIEQLVEADDDGQRDAYERHAGVTSLVTTGAAGNGGQVAFLTRISPDGLRALFYTFATLDPADTDGFQDVYQRSEGVTTLVSTGPSGGNGSFNATPVGLAATADRAYFYTDESLTAADTDEVGDVYERAGGVTTLVSTGPSGGNGPFPATFDAISADGGRLYFGTAEALVADDGDTDRDVYERAGDVVTLISTGPDDGENGGDSYFQRLSADGGRLIFASYESLFAADQDEEYDLYVSALDPSSVDPPADPPPAPAPPASAKRALRCAGKPATIVGTARRDVLKGTGKRDVIVALGGNDKILARGGNDIVCAGAGRDVVMAGAGADRVYGQAGDDRVFGQGGRDLLFGNAGRDLLDGGAHRGDRCRGGAGKDRVRKCER